MRGIAFSRPECTRTGTYTRTAAGRLVLNVLGAVPQWEPDAIGERTSAAMQHKASRGEYIGGAAPLGYRLAQNGRLEALEAEQAAISEARVLPGPRASRSAP